MKIIENRRKALFGIGGVVAASAAAVVVQSSGPAQLAAGASPSSPLSEDGENKGYRLTEHVKRYYQTTLV